MYYATWHKNILTFTFLAGFILLFSFGGSSAALAQGASRAAFVRLVRAFDTDNIGNLKPVGLAFSPKTNNFLVLEANRPPKPRSPVSDLIRITPVEDRVGSVTIAAVISDPINIAFDSKANRLLLFDAVSNKLIEIKARPDGTLDPTTLTRHNARSFGLHYPQGMSVDPESGHLFILDTVGPRLVRVAPDPDQGFDNAVITAVDLRPTGLVDVRGLAFDPTTGHLHLFSLAEQELIELTQTGQPVATRDLSEFELRNPRGMVFAPSGDQTDDPLQMNLYLADRDLGTGQRQEANSLASGQTDPVGYQIYLPLVMAGSSGGDEEGDSQEPGTIIELSFVEPVQPIRVAAADFTSNLVQTIDAWLWSPPSPDSAGIVYLPASNHLLVSDSEVNELPIFTGDNLFETTLTGNLIDTLTTISFSDEPTGVTLKPSNGHLFISDDTGNPRVIYEMDPGPDGNYDTPDDVITSFPAPGSDPEGVTYAPEGVTFPAGALFIADGLNNEVYQVTPGPNGIFDGVDDQAQSFDTFSLGLEDPEGIAFNPDNGNLYLAGKTRNIGTRNFDTLLEVTTGGALVRTIDVSAANALRLSGLAYAPSSLDPKVMNIYIADRGVDNISDPNENDGRVYEMTVRVDLPVANDDSASTPEDTPVTIDVAANDTDPEGNLDPTSANTTCGTCAGPANGTLNNNGDGTFDYTPNANFNGGNNFVYEICDTGGLCDIATVTITVDPVNDPPVANDDSASTPEDTPVTIDVAANDTDLDGNLDPASASASCGTCVDAADGTLINNGDGTFDYTPNPDFSGNDSFKYEICDTGGLCDTATVSITVPKTFINLFLPLILGQEAK